MFHDGVVLPHAPALRALNLAKEKLGASEEVEVVEYAPYKQKEGYSIIVRQSNMRLPVTTHARAPSARLTFPMVGSPSVNASRTAEKTYIP